MGYTKGPRVKIRHAISQMATFQSHQGSNSTRPRPELTQPQPHERRDDPGPPPAPPPPRPELTQPQPHERRDDPGPLPALSAVLVAGHAHQHHHPWQTSDTELASSAPIVGHHIPEIQHAHAWPANPPAPCEICGQTPCCAHCSGTVNFIELELPVSSTQFQYSVPRFMQLAKVGRWKQIAVPVDVQPSPWSSSAELDLRPSIPSVQSNVTAEMFELCVQDMIESGHAGMHQGSLLHSRNGDQSIFAQIGGHRDSGHQCWRFVWSAKTAAAKFLKSLIWPTLQALDLDIQSLSAESAPEEVCFHMILCSGQKQTATGIHCDLEPGMFGRIGRCFEPATGSHQRCLCFAPVKTLDPLEMLSPAQFASQAVSVNVASGGCWSGNRATMGTRTFHHQNCEMRLAHRANVGGRVTGLLVTTLMRASDEQATKAIADTIAASQPRLVEWDVSTPLRNVFAPNTLRPAMCQFGGPHPDVDKSSKKRKRRGLSGRDCQGKPKVRKQAVETYSTTDTPLGFAWDARQAAWDHRFGELQAFKAAEGHCNVPQGWLDNKPLARWASNQRTYRRMFVDNPHDPSASITPERIDRLEALGFVWKAARGAVNAVFGNAPVIFGTNHITPLHH
jgi:hypothetical protein